MSDLATIRREVCDAAAREEYLAGVSAATPLTDTAMRDLASRFPARRGDDIGIVVEPQGWRNGIALRLPGRWDGVRTSIHFGDVFPEYISGMISWEGTLWIIDELTCNYVGTSHNVLVGAVCHRASPQEAAYHGQRRPWKTDATKDKG